MVYMIGWSHSHFGKLADDTIESLIVGAARGAISDAGVAPADIDAIFLGHFNSGFVKQDFCSSLALDVSDDLRFKPATRVENACATGSAAIYSGLAAIASGKAKIALVIGAEKMTDKGGSQIGDILLHACYQNEESHIDGGFAGVFGLIADAYAARFGDPDDALALIAAKNHANGVHNPFAQLRKDLGYDFCRAVSEKNPIVAGRLKRTDCSPVSDGAAAIVLASDDAATGAVKSVRFCAAVQANDFMPMSRRDMSRFEGAQVAWRKAFDTSRMTLDDLDLAETHDCFTIAELMQYEAMGLAELGRGADAIREGWTHVGGKLPINPSGGLKAKGHPIGATGVSMHVMAARQLMGEGGGAQVPRAKAAGVFNMGGSGVANYASILERTR